MSRRGKDCEHAKVERGAREALPSQIECRNRRLPFRKLTRHPLTTLQKPPPLLSGSTCPRPPPRPPIPAPARPPALLANPCAALRSSRGFHRLCEPGQAYVTRRACPRGPPLRLCSTSSRAQRLLSASEPCESSFCRKAARRGGVSRRRRLPAQEALGFPPGSPATARAMFGAGDEDDTDFLSPSGG